MSKFAPMTAGLLARKGEAFPASYFSMPPPRIAAAPMHDLRFDEPPPPPPVAFAAQPASLDHHADAHRVRHDVARPHKLRVALSDAEFERFGHAAVKHNVSRTQLIREALDSYVEKLIATYRGDCRCIGGDGACGSSAPCGSL